MMVMDDRGVMIWAIDLVNGAVATRAISTYCSYSQHSDVTELSTNNIIV
jgi:hypothetical protein